MKFKRYVWPSIAGAFFILGLWVGRGGEWSKETKATQTNESVASVSTTKGKEVKERVTLPDGTVIEKETRTVATTDKHKQERSKSELKTREASKQSVERYRVGLVAQTRLSELVRLQQPLLGLQLERRLLGPLWVGAQVFEDRSVGLSVSLSF